MRPFIAIAVLLVATVGLADDSPLVKAAKANGGPKKKTTKKVITNADLAKSPGGKATPAPAAKPAAPPSQQGRYRHYLAAETGRVVR